MNIKHDMRTIADEDATLGIEPMLFEGLQLLEETGDVDDAAAADEVDAAGIDEARGEDVEVVGDAIGDNGVASVVAALGATAERGVVREDVDEFAFAFVAELAAQTDGDGHDGIICVCSE